MCVLRSRIQQIRTKLVLLDVDGFILPYSDGRLDWLIGLSVSSAVAVVLKEHAAVFVDGRYFLQLTDRLDASVCELVNCSKKPIHEWLKMTVGSGDRIGLDPRFHTISKVRTLTKELSSVGAELVSLEDKPLEELWNIQESEGDVVEDGLVKPSLLGTGVSIQPVELTGTSTEEKLYMVRRALAERNAQFMVLTELENIAWTLNIRGSDVEFTPVVQATAVIAEEKENSFLFLDMNKLDSQVSNYLARYVHVRPTEDLYSVLREEVLQPGDSVTLDPNKTTEAIGGFLGKLKANIVEIEDPITSFKAVKTSLELEGARRAHLRDGVAMARFLTWFDVEAAKGDLDEQKIADALLHFRGDLDMFRGSSFEPIVGSGPNGAMIHYRITEKTNRSVERNSTVLVDSGAQFRDGTTDVTRTIAVGSVSQEIKDRATRVLKGHIALASARFPVGTTGAQLDALARMPLWQVGLDYDHGTGHGVGSYLGVHEGPQNISKSGKSPLRPGMILSNEPGYYKPGAYGIRIESLMIVTDPVDMVRGDQPMCGFEVLTMVPIDTRLIDVSLMTEMELIWLNDYHARILKVLSVNLEEDEVSRWLVRATRSIGNPD